MPDRPPNIEMGYYADDEHKILYIPILKCASRSVHNAIKPWHRQIERHVAVELSKDYYTVAVIRHPWDRIVSGLWTALRDYRPFEERVKEYILYKEPIYINSHVRPQWFILRDLEVDCYIRVDRIQEDWVELKKLYPHLGEITHTHVSTVRPKGWNDLYDWTHLWYLYKGDFDLCPDWEH